MKKIIILLISLGLFISCSGRSSQNDRVVFAATGEIQTEERNISDFNEVVIKGPIELIVKQESFSDLKIESYESILDCFVSVVEDSVLYLYIQDTSGQSNVNINYNGSDLSTHVLNSSQLGWGKEERILNVYLSINKLQDLSLIGDVDVTSANELVQDELKVTVVGRSDVKLEISAKLFNMEVAGAVDADLSGQVGTFDIDCAGIGTFNALEMAADTVTINASGYCRTRVYAKNSLDIELAGMGKIYYKGNPDDISIDKAGFGKVQRISE